MVNIMSFSIDVEQEKELKEVSRIYNISKSKIARDGIAREIADIKKNAMKKGDS